MFVCLPEGMCEGMHTRVCAQKASFRFSVARRLALALISPNTREMMSATSVCQQVCAANMLLGTLAVSGGMAAGPFIGRGTS